MGNTYKILASTFIGVQALTVVSVQAEGMETAAVLTLEEITVKAQRREESLQTVPGAINAISGADLDSAGLGDLKSLGQRTPGVYFENQSKSRAVLAMRGVGQSGAISVGSPAVGVFVDGVYMPRTSGAIQNFGNIERVEVLKGPQGTLYGRNTIGGALSIYTQKPDHETEAYVEGGLGNRGTWEAGAYISGSLSEDKLAGSLSLNKLHKGGDRKEVLSGIENDSDDVYARARLVFTPTSELEVDLIASYSNETADAALEEPQNADIPFLSPFIPPAIVAGAVSRSAEDFYSNEVSEPGHIDIETFLASATINWTSDQVQLTSISGYFHSDIRTLRDFDGSVFDVVTIDDKSESKTFSQEFRLTSVPGGFLTLDDNLEWLVGLFYLHDDASQKFGINLGTDSVFSATSTGLPANDLFHSTVMTDSYAIFGQATYAITNRLNLTLGARYSKDDLDFIYRASTDTPGVPIVVVDFIVQDQLSFESFDPRVVLDYQFTDDVMAYVSYNKGYRSGGIQFATPNPVVAAQPVDKETVKAWEIGLKSRFFDGRMQLNTSFFSYDYEDMQRNGIVIVGGAPVSLTANAAAADLKGLELDIKFLAAEGLIFEAGYSYLDTKFSEYNFVGVDLTGNTLPLAPENSFRLAVQYDFDVADWEAGIRLDYSWRDEIFFEENNSAIGGQGEAVGLLGASLRLTSPDDHIEVSLYCSNCFDKKYAAFVTLIGDSGYGVQSTGDRVRFGVNVKYRF